MDTTIKGVKEQAKALQKALSEVGHDLGYSQCLELISQRKGFLDWNAYCAYLKSNDTTESLQATHVSMPQISDLRRLALIATAPTCRLIVLIDDFFDTDFTVHPISEKLPWARALRAMEKFSSDAVFLFHPPTALYKEIDILACCRPAYVFMSEQEFLEIEAHMRRFHENLLLFRCSELMKQASSLT